MTVTALRHFSVACHDCGGEVRLDESGPTPVLEYAHRVTDCPNLVSRSGVRPDERHIVRKGSP